MSWDTADTINRDQFSRRGLAASLSAVRICREAERLFPNLFQAQSVRNGVLTLATLPEHKLGIKLIEGALIKQLNQYATTHSLPLIRRIRLTNPRD